MGSGKLPLSPVPREHPFRQGAPSAVCPCLRKRWKKFRQPEGNGWEWKTRSPLPLLGTGETLVPARGPLRCAPSLARKVEKMPAARRERAGMGSGELPLLPVPGEHTAARGLLPPCALICEKGGKNAGSPKGEGTAGNGSSLLLSGTSPGAGKRRPRRDQSAPSSHCPLFSSERKRAGQVICRPARPLPGMGSQKMRVSGRPCGRKRGYCAETAARRASTRSVFSQGTFRSSLPRWP